MVMSVGWAVGEGCYGEIFDVVGGGRVLAVVLFVFFSHFIFECPGFEQYRQGEEGVPRGDPAGMASFFARVGRAPKERP